MNLLLYLVICTLFLPQLATAATDWDEGQVQQYIHNSELQRRSSWQLLSQIRFQGAEKVLDVGCGDGRNSAWISRLVRDGSCTGIDPSTSMIHWAKRQYHPSEFPNLTFLDGSFDHLPDDQYDLITSFFSLHFVKDKAASLANVASHLKPGGRFVCVAPPFQSNPEYDEALQIVCHAQKWRAYFKAFTSNFNFVSLEQYKAFFAKSGLTLIRAEFCPSVDPFVTIQEFKDWFKGTMSHVHYLPQELQDAFIEDLVSCYLFLRPEAQGEDGTLYFHWGRFEFVAELPLENCDHAK